MAEPVCAQKFPYALELAAGEYWWCACGKSAKQPFCDGSHKGSEFSPGTNREVWRVDTRLETLSPGQ